MGIPVADTVNVLGMHEFGREPVRLDLDSYFSTLDIEVDIAGDVGAAHGFGLMRHRLRGMRLPGKRRRPRHVETPESKSARICSRSGLCLNRCRVRLKAPTKKGGSHAEIPHQGVLHA